MIVQNTETNVYLQHQRNVSIVPTKLISNPVSKFLLKKNYEVSNLAFLGCGASSFYQSFLQSISLLILNIFLFVCI